MESRYDILFKLLLIGDSSVGKTSILIRFTEDNFNPTFTSTIGIDFKLRTVEIDGRKVKLQLWDTAGQERYRTTCTSYFRGAMGIILVYDITNEKSFKSITTWMNSIAENASDDVEKMIIGNKCDLAESRIISTERGRLLAESHGAKFLETSAKSGENVEMGIMTIATDIKHKIDRKNAETSDVNSASPSSEVFQVREDHEPMKSKSCQC